MKIATALLLVAFAASAHAELLAPKAARAELKVEYVYTSAGSYIAPAKDMNNQWRVRRSVELTAQYSADAPQAMGTLHTSDPKQKADLANIEARTASAQRKLQPMAMDMMAIAASCGIAMDGPDVSAAQEKAQEACVEKAVSDYGNNMEMTPDIKSAGADIAAVNKAMENKRFQLWTVTSQSGTYSIDEEHHKQVFELTCTQTKVCKRDDIRKGGGAITAPPGGKSGGVSMVEVDTVNKEMVLALPVPLMPLGYKQTVTTTIPDEQSSTKDTVMPVWMMNAAKPVTVSIPGGVVNMSGTKTIPVEGAGAERGTITVKWQFKRL